jgi:hypothetical protein
MCLKTNLKPLGLLRHPMGSAILTLGFVGNAQKKETLQVLSSGAVPDDGEQARPAGSEKPKVVIMATHLYKHGSLSVSASKPFFCNRTNPGRKLGVFFFDRFFFASSSLFLICFLSVPGFLLRDMLSLLGSLQYCGTCARSPEIPCRRALSKLLA